MKLKLISPVYCIDQLGNGVFFIAPNEILLASFPEYAAINDGINTAWLFLP